MIQVFQSQYPCLKNTIISFKEIDHLQEPYRFFPNVSKIPNYEFHCTIRKEGESEAVFFYQVEWQQDIVSTSNGFYLTQPIRTLFASRIDNQFFMDLSIFETIFMDFVSQFVKQGQLVTLD